MLRNFERKTGETLIRSDLEEHRLAEKLTPEDYDLKSQVTLTFCDFPPVLMDL